MEKLESKIILDKNHWDIINALIDEVVTLYKKRIHDLFLK